MKKILVILLATVKLSLASAQSVSDTVYFNNYSSATNNDLTNHFSNTSWITMDTIHGITGGALNTPNTLSWGNDLIWYCKYYTNVIDSGMNASVSFKWNSALINTTTYDRGAAIFFEGNVVNHNYACYLNRDRTVTLITYGGVYVTSPLTLINGHWYRFSGGLSSLSAAPGDWMVGACYMSDLGLSGTANPIQVMYQILMVEDSDVVNSPQFNVRICGAKWGGGEYLDDFIYHGIPGTINCVSTSVNENYFNSDAVTIYPQPANDLVYVSLNGNKKHTVISYSVTDITGREVMKEETAMNDVFSLNVQQLPGGIYFLRVKSGSQLFSKKMVVE